MTDKEADEIIGDNLKLMREIAQLRVENNKLKNSPIGPTKQRDIVLSYHNFITNKFDLDVDKVWVEFFFKKQG